MHYARHLSKRYDVLAVAGSGTTKDTLRVDYFWHFKGRAKFDAAEFENNQVAGLDEIVEAYSAHEAPRKAAIEDLEKFAEDLNSTLHNMRISASDRSMLISAILLALKDQEYADAYNSMNSEQLIRATKSVALKQLKRSKVDVATLHGMKSALGFLTPEGLAYLSRNANMRKLIDEINATAMPVIRRLQHYDAIGKFYLEFLSYSNREAELGIVLTPPHITELATAMAQVTMNDIVYDNCAGTGGFLITAMGEMLKSAGKDNMRKHKIIKTKQVIGIEAQPQISALLLSNMYFHGDGKSRIRFGDCFIPKHARWAKATMPTVGLLNPPFRNKKNPQDIAELQFVSNNLAALVPGGRCAAILPMSCARATKNSTDLELRRKLLQSHTLDAVISLPDKLFYNSHANVVTCLMLFRAHVPHSKGGKHGTWFAYGKDDGFRMMHHRGRQDTKARWPEILQQWIKFFCNREVVDGFSVVKRVGPEDELLAEAYLEPAYSDITMAEPLSALRDFVLHQYAKQWDAPDEGPMLEQKLELQRLDTLFAITRGHDLAKAKCKTDNAGVNFVARGRKNNGIVGRVRNVDGVEPHPAGLLTVAAGGSVLETFYQTEPFYTGVGTLCLRPKVEMGTELLLAYCALIRANQFRYNYGREANARNLGAIMLPSPQCIPAALLREMKQMLPDALLCAK